MTTDNKLRQVEQLGLMAKYLEAHGWVQAEEWMNYRKDWSWNTPLFATQAALKQFAADLPAVLEAVARDEGRCEWTHTKDRNSESVHTQCNRLMYAEDGEGDDLKFGDYTFCPFCGRRIVIVDEGGEHGEV